MKASIGDGVYIYSIVLDEIIEGIVEGYADAEQRKLKILQSISAEEDKYLRHIVSYVFVFTSYEEACKCREDYLVDYNFTDLVAGNVVYLLDKARNPILDNKGSPCLYQIVAVYRDTERASIVTSYGEHVGTYDMSLMKYVEEGPIFKKEDYAVGTQVVWADGEDVYEGVISTLYDTSAKIVDIKKLMPVNNSVRVPYWKIPEGRKSIQDHAPQVVHTIVGDDLD